MSMVGLQLSSSTSTGCAMPLREGKGRFLQSIIILILQARELIVGVQDLTGISYSPAEA